MAKTLVRNVTVWNANGPVVYGPAAGNQASVPNDVAAQITSATAWALTAASQAEMLALSSATVGDVCLRTDTDPDSVYILTATPPATLGNWTLLNPQSVADAVLDGVNLATQAELTAAISGLSGTYVPTNPVIADVVLDADGNWTSWTEAGVACSATYDSVTGNMETLTVGTVTRTFSYDAEDNLVGAA